ncbi:hypothetical protein DKM44_12790 [Deinococcus irradiatisoli]|uniref:Uncharacterized protein n=1 Tax=Deinococcus irradiatisoli TaxID=2202254 RepID=A0A2Z3JRM9_9DEIO|nr:hypothetical protein [Deinococcus irradiatisoli]AWN23998.1 hypothetical protein DKM44_12790 [Deinococcus irradiatisoli]
MITYERFHLHTPSRPSGIIELNATYVPAVLSPAATTPNLVRARGYRKVYDLSDGLADPTPIIFTGYERADSEAELSRLLSELRADIRAAVSVDRDGRVPVPVQGGTMIAVPITDDSASPTGLIDSTQALVTITLVPAMVPDLDSYFLW